MRTDESLVEIRALNFLFALETFIGCHFYFLIYLHPHARIYFIVNEKPFPNCVKLMIIFFLFLFNIFPFILLIILSDKYLMQISYRTLSISRFLSTVSLPLVFRKKGIFAFFSVSILQLLILFWAFFHIWRQIFLLILIFLILRSFFLNGNARI